MTRRASSVAYDPKVLVAGLEYAAYPVAFGG